MLIVNLVASWMPVVTFTPLEALPESKELPRTRVKTGGPQSYLDAFGEIKTLFSLRGIEPRFLDCLTEYKNLKVNLSLYTP